LLKNSVRYCILLFVDKALCLSAAEKREYEAFGSSRQPLLFYRFTVACASVVAAGAEL
jgi:hypothetical protein